jgi:general secretion pathway protein K
MTVTPGFFGVANEPTTQRGRLLGSAQGRKTFLPAQPRLGRNSNDSGFALVAVIWSLGLVSLLGVAVIVGARYRTKVASNQAAVMATTAAAESAINLAIALSLTGTPQQNVKFPLRCRMPNGEQATISLEEETGKVDLNTATTEVLSRLFTALSSDQSAGMRIAASILEYRNTALAKAKAANNQLTGKPASNEQTRFTTIMQLDQIDGISPLLFRAALRFVTVRSGRAEPERDAASPALRKLLNLDQAQPARPRAPPAAGNVTIRADVSGADGSRFIREALISLGSEDGRPFRILEWRHGDIEPRESMASTRPQDAAGGPEGRCFTVSPSLSQLR